MSVTTEHVYALQLRVLQSKARRTERFIIEDAADHALTTFTQKLMRDRLAQARDKGKQGWWNPSECTRETLENLLHASLAKKSLIDVINYAAMLHARNLVEEMQ